MGNGVRAAAPRPRARGDARLPRRRAGARDPRDGPQPALHRRASTSRGIGGDDDRRGAGRGGQPRRRRRAERAPSPASSTALPGDGAGAQPHEGPRPGDGRAALDARPRPARRRALRPEHRRGDRRAASRGGGDRVRDAALAVQLQLAINSPTFRVYVNDDLVGVELCAAAKNVIALAAGGADGLGLGDNAKAALVARGLAEMGRLAEARGRAPGDVRRPRRDGRPDRHLLVAVGPQPPRRRADRAGRDAGGGRRRRSGWSSRA